jgi:hypothetical protein
MRIPTSCRRLETADADAAKSTLIAATAKRIRKGCERVSEPTIAPTQTRSKRRSVSGNKRILIDERLAIAAIRFLDTVSRQRTTLECWRLKTEAAPSAIDLRESGAWL